MASLVSQASLVASELGRPSELGKFSSKILRIYFEFYITTDGSTFSYIIFRVLVLPHVQRRIGGVPGTIVWLAKHDMK